MTHNEFNDPRQLTLPGVPLPAAPDIIGLIGAKQSGKDIIGLIGAKQSGKDTICALLAAHRPLTRLAFADGVKEEVADAIGVPVAFIEEHKRQLRPLLQHWGTELRRELFDRDYWVKRLVAKLAHVRTPLIVVTDVRFANEARALAERGARLVRVIRGPVSGDTHASEVWVNSAEARSLAPEEIHNSGTLEDLHLRVVQQLA